MNAVIDEFKKQLSLVNGNSDYILLTKLPAVQVKFQFIGKFENQDLIWDSHLFALNNNALINGLSRQSYIDISEPENYSAQISVGLPVQIITAAVISKTIIMIRNYKFLQRGRHNFGR